MTKILFGMPCYSGIERQAHNAVVEIASRPDVVIANNTSTLIAMQRNIFWCDALNDRTYTHVCMMDSDIQPEHGWLDKMLAEMQAVGADVLSVVSPMKDESGDTSMATAQDNALTRLSMARVRCLPETFCSKDVGARLCVNTGLILCDMTGSWVQQVWFEINDAIRQVEEKWRPVNMPEDWNFSLMAQTFGAKVFATRKVKLTHWGRKGWVNQ